MKKLCLNPSVVTVLRSSKPEFPALGPQDAAVPQTQIDLLKEKQKAGYVGK